MVVRYPELFGRSLLTTNFDPLIEVSVRRSGGFYFRTTLHRDGNLSQTEGIGCHIVHLHGYWYGSDTLHTARQLSQSRPRLKASLRSFLTNKLVVACAYSGWDDTFTEALMEVVLDDMAFPEILWTFFSETPAPPARLSQRLTARIDRGRVNLYGGIDCNKFLPLLCRKWMEIQPNANPLAPSSGQVSAKIQEQVGSMQSIQIGDQRVIEGDDEDHPPVVDICVGRESELGQLRNSLAQAIFLTGLGGQGKSTLAAKYFSGCQNTKERFEAFVWRDCKEESDRFENQVIFVIEKLSRGRVGGPQFSLQSEKAIIESFLLFLEERSILFVFDNADHYVDLDAGKLVGSAGLFIEALINSKSASQVIFTCRPIVEYSNYRALTCRLEGLALDAAKQLFSSRGALTRTDEIEDAHSLTEGHAFWLDLLAIQISKRAPHITLTSLVDEIRSGGGPLPAATLNSIWSTLHGREQTVLRAMAETVKPEDEGQIAEYLRYTLNYQRTMKAIRALRSANLIVVKRRRGGKDLLELHPLVRQFIRQNFSPPERLVDRI